MYEMLSKRFKMKDDLDELSYSLKDIFQTITKIFDNEKNIINLPVDSYDILGIEEIDPNDLTHIRIPQDCERI